MPLVTRLKRLVRGRKLPSPSRRDYYATPELGLDGHRCPERRLAGWEALARHARNRTVLDLGCAEGLMLRRLLREGARRGHGLDNSAHRIASARRVCALEPARFDVMELNRPGQLDAAPFLEPSYDCVLMLGVYQHLLERSRDAALVKALARCREIFAFRVPRRRLHGAPRVIREQGFELVEELDPRGAEQLLIYRRRAPALPAAA
ncbi:class I SAM-dependent methyltransferase [Marinimicrococcus flavescens]|uniref:Class I SAM-dependent methyltransferase n=1 Tax=Marinimicrococcus flavescens TaxID=3031815 RepID=A0AAP4D631_9PROT|nr:class I SAM-dependent methyltransferase [Marinimicrococcus flavescens]